MKGGVNDEGKSGKRVVAVLLASAVGVAFVAWVAASRIEQSTNARQSAADEAQNTALLSEGVLYEATAGEPGLVIAKDVASGKELWRAELGAVTTQPALSIRNEVIEVQIAGTPWMSLDRATGEPVE